MGRTGIEHELDEHFVGEVAEFADARQRRHLEHPEAFDKCNVWTIKMSIYHINQLHVCKPNNWFLRNPYLSTPTTSSRRRSCDQTTGRNSTLPTRPSATDREKWPFSICSAIWRNSSTGRERRHGINDSRHSNFIIVFDVEMVCTRGRTCVTSYNKTDDNNFMTIKYYGV